MNPSTPLTFAAPSWTAAANFSVLPVSEWYARRILAGRVCIMGNVPMSLLATGTVEQVKEHCRTLLDLMGQDGGYIMSPAPVLDDAKSENVRALIDFTREISEQVILAIPFKPLCREDCRGLCAICGADLNEIECTCGRDDANFKFNALKNLKIN